MSQRFAVAFGQNAVDQNALEYDDWSGLLSGCVPDARGLAQCASNMGYDSRALFSGWNVGRTPAPGEPWVMTSDCTRQAWRDIHASLQGHVQPGDEVLIGNSGHGAQYMAPFYGNNESMCFWDGTITDVEFHQMMCGWPEGVKVMYVLDTCFSSGMDKDRQKFTPKVAPKWMVAASPTREKSGDIKAAVLQLCACAKGETAGDSQIGGVFISNLLGVWEQARAQGKLLTRQSWLWETASVVQTFAPQHPQLNVLGAGASIVDKVLPM